MKRFLSLGMAMIITAASYSDTYKDALRKFENSSVPLFAKEQIDGSRKLSIAEIPALATFSVIHEEPHADQAMPHPAWKDSLAVVDSQLNDKAALRMQQLAAAGKIDEVLQNTFSVDDVIAVAYVRNRGIQSASEAFFAARQRYPQSRYLDAVARQYNAFTKTMNLMLGAGRNPGSRINAEYPSPGMTSLRQQIVNMDVAIAGLDFEMTVRDTLAKVKSAFYEYAYLVKAVRITRDNQELLEQMLQVVMRKFEAGRSSYNDVIKVRMELAKISNDGVTLSEQCETITVKINTLLDRSADAALGQPADASHPSLPGINELFAVAENYRQEIRQWRSKEDRANSMVALAEKMNRPDATLGASYFQDRSALLVGSVQEKPAFQPAPRLPLRPWFGQREAYITEMRHRQNQWHEKWLDVINQTRAEVKEKYFAVDTASRELELYKIKLLPDARQSLQVAEQDFEGARIDFLDYLDAQRTWLDLNLASYRAQRNLGAAVAELEKVVGRALH
jgi:outer membrane protein, heavy metal efflux system